MVRLGQMPDGKVRGWERRGVRDVSGRDMFLLDASHPSRFGHFGHNGMESGVERVGGGGERGCLVSSVETCAESASAYGSVRTGDGEAWSCTVTDTAGEKPTGGNATVTRAENLGKIWSAGWGGGDGRNGAQVLALCDTVCGSQHALLDPPPPSISARPGSSSRRRGA